MIEKQQKHCPYCGGHSPLGTPCSPECEEHHNKFHARAVWHKRFYLTTIAVCFLWMLRGTIPMPVRAAIAVGWAVWLCIARIVMPYSYRVIGCEKRPSGSRGSLGSSRSVCSVRFCYSFIHWMQRMFTGFFPG